MSANQALQRATEQLVAAVGDNDDDADGKEAAFGAFMKLLPQLASDICGDGGPSPASSAWAEAHAKLLGDARRALADWSMSLARYFDRGGEDEAERALRKRSQFALLEELFKNTAVAEWLGGHMDEEFDRDLRQAALRMMIEPPDWVPRSHWWWRWPDD